MTLLTTKTIPRPRIDVGVTCENPSCGETLDDHDGPNMECSAFGCFCTEYEGPTL